MRAGLVDRVEQSLRSDPLLFIATDGSAVDDVAWFAVVDLDTEAQTAYRAEVDAGIFTLDAAFEAAPSAWTSR